MSKTKALLLSIITLFVISYCANRVMAEVWWTKFGRTGDVAHLDNALKYDPKNTIYNIYMGMATAKNPPVAMEYIDRALYWFNGDVVLWTTWFQKGQVLASIGDIRGAKSAFEKASYYWPTWDDPKKAIAQMQDILDSGKPIMIQFGEKK